ncbi:PREDICTED: LRRN4 C-terminal-like protein [Nanorana parkeri]|uniref:LRRN4 C-terminal-like protein n=1 Tax=Nanorana parkeri TaxID=125878 RepID=UPI0008544FA0|nr:PREDICTED: LRRN4 C-terminal-like protein [Nanorana parkeri]
MSCDRKFFLSWLLLLLLPLCAAIPGLHAERNNTAETEENKNNTVPLNNTVSPLTTASPDYEDDQSSVAQPRKITQSHKTTRERIPFITEDIDYDNYEDDEDNGYKKQFTLPPQVFNAPCPFDRCKHLELPCSEIQKSTGGKCSCPGISGRSILPDAPRLNVITPGQTGISVSWCSPLSTVQGYRLLYGSPEGPLEKGPLLNQSYRFFSIPNLVPGMPYRVCVVAINDAGESQLQPSDGEEGWPGPGGITGPCGIYNTYDPYGSYIYLAVGIGLAILAGLVGIFVFVYWFRCRKGSRKLKRAIGEEMGVTNMSFKAESVENL